MGQPIPLSQDLEATWCQCKDLKVSLYLRDLILIIFTFLFCGFLMILFSFFFLYKLRNILVFSFMEIILSIVYFN